MTLRELSDENIMRLYRRLIERTSARDWRMLSIINRGIYNDLIKVHREICYRGQLNSAWYILT